MSELRRLTNLTILDMIVLLFLLICLSLEQSYVVAETMDEQILANSNQEGLESNEVNSLASKSILQAKKGSELLKSKQSDVNGFDVFKMLLGLMVVVGLILILTKWLKQMQMVKGFKGQNIEFQHSVQVGAKEKLVIIKVDGKRLLLGVTASQINLIERLSDEELVSDSDHLNSNNNDFASKLLTLIQGNKSNKKSQAVASQLDQLEGGEDEHLS